MNICGGSCGATMLHGCRRSILQPGQHACDGVEVKQRLKYVKACKMRQNINSKINKSMPKNVFRIFKLEIFGK